MKKISFTIVMIITIAFIAILYFTGNIGQYFGKYAENISLAAIGVILIVMLVKGK